MSHRRDRICFENFKYVVYQPYRGLHVAYHAKKFRFSCRSKFQKIDLIDNDAYGRMLFLDGNVQCTSYDSRIFNEALCGVAKTNSVSNIIVLGGGSGQTLLSLLESSSVKRVTIVEIDPLVVECCRKYIDGVDQAFKDERVSLIIGDAFRYLHSVDGKFDAAIVDLTENPFGLKRGMATLKRMYGDIKEKCEGRCSQYVGSSVGLARGPRFRLFLHEVSGKFLTGVRFEDVFIPSFGAPHTFMHAGYDLN